MQRRLRESQASITRLEGIRDALADKVDIQADNLKNANQRFQMILDIFNIASFHCDTQHNYVWSHNFIGNSEDLVGKNDFDILPHEAAAQLMTLKKRALADGGVHHQDVVINAGDGERTYSISVAPRTDRYGHVVGTLYQYPVMSRNVRYGSAIWSCCYAK